MHRAVGEQDAAITQRSFRVVEIEEVIGADLLRSVPAHCSMQQRADVQRPKRAPANRPLDRGPQEAKNLPNRRLAGGRRKLRRFPADRAAISSSTLQPIGAAISSAPLISSR